MTRLSLAITLLVLLVPGTSCLTTRHAAHRDIEIDLRDAEILRQMWSAWWAESSSDLVLWCWHFPAVEPRTAYGWRQIELCNAHFRSYYGPWNRELKRYEKGEDLEYIERFDKASRATQQRLEQLGLLDGPRERFPKRGEVWPILTEELRSHGVIDHIMKLAGPPPDQLYGRIPFERDADYFDRRDLPFVTEIIPAIGDAALDRGFTICGQGVRVSPLLERAYADGLKDDPEFRELHSRIATLVRDRMGATADYEDPAVKLRAQRELAKVLGELRVAEWLAARGIAVEE